MTAIAGMCVHKKSFAGDCKKCKREYMKKKPILPEKYEQSPDDYTGGWVGGVINQLINYLRYLEERIFKLEKGD